MSISNPQSVRANRSVNPWVLICGIGAAGIVLVVLVLAVLGWITPELPIGENERRMPDGSILRIEGLTWGTKHSQNYEYSPRSFWPKKTHEKVSVWHESTRPELRVWMSRHNAKTGEALDFGWWLKTDAFDQYGNEISDREPLLNEFGKRGRLLKISERPIVTDPAFSIDGWLASSSFPGFRLQGDRFRLRVKDVAGREVATFELTHPSPPPEERWEPEDFPITKTEGNLTAYFRGMNVQLSTESRGGVTQEKWIFYPSVRISEDPRTGGNWAFSMLDMRDSLGNAMGYGRQLSQQATAWKVEGVAFNNSNGIFLPEETWTLAEMATPERHSAKLLTDVKTIDGVEVSLIALAGEGQTNYAINSPNVSAYLKDRSLNAPDWAFGAPPILQLSPTGSSATRSVNSPWTHLTLEATKLTNLHRVYVKAKDDQGRDVPTQQVLQSKLPLKQFFFKTEPNAKSLTLSIIVHHGRAFEFCIKPPKLVTTVIGP